MEIREKIKQDHYAFYERMNWSHPKTCICKGWKVKPETELEAIEQRSETQEEFKEDELGF